MELIVGIIGGLIILVVLVVVHELGHAIAARRNGVVVEEFGVGFPPRAWAKKLKKSILGKNVLLTVNWLPLGGFVKLQGEHDDASKKGDYGAATFWQKTKILLAGVAMNWVLAALVLTGLAWTGLPKIMDNQFSVASDTRIETGPVLLTAIVPDSAAEDAAFQAGDTIVAVNDEAVSSNREFIDATRTHAGQDVVITFVREGSETTQTVTLGEDIEKGVFGANVGQREFIRATWSAPIVGVVTTGQLSWATVEGLGSILGKFVSGFALQWSSDEATRQQAEEDLDTVSSSIAGPVGILGVIFPTAQQQGPTQLLFLTAIISLTLAVMNILPIPALDGGRWFVTALFRLLRRPLTKDVEERIHGIGFMVLLGLIVLVTIADVSKLFGS